jgi:hypothetical protein
VRLRDYLSMVFFYYTMWPPIWVSASVQAPEGEVGGLVEVRVRPRRIFLVMEHEAERFTGCLMFQDDASCERVANLLQRCYGMRIEDIGDLEITFSVTSPSPDKRLFNRWAYWIISRLMAPRC